MMRKFLAIMLTIVMLLSVCACADNGKAEKYCSSCGEGISKDVAFCSQCGASVNSTQSERKNGANDNSTTAKSETKQTDKPASTTKKPTEIKKPIQTTKSVQTTKPNETSKPTTPTHAHSYSQTIVAATCTEKGYTVFTCSCGNTYEDNYTNPIHTYSKYKCTKCGIVDKSHTYEYVKEWVKENGKVNGELIQKTLITADNLCSYNLNYWESTGILYAFLLVRDSEAASTDSMLTISIDLSGKNNKFTYTATRGIETYSYYAKGIIDGKTFKEGSALPCSEYDGPTLYRSVFLEACRSMATDVLLYLSACLNEEIDGVTMADLGFECF